ncbi:nucleotidyltransferase domain-containing protein [Pseudomonas sp. NA13]
MLSVRWLERFDKPAPIEFDQLREVIDGEPELHLAIDDLLAIKRASPEMGLSPQIMPIQKFIERELNRLEDIKPTRSERKEVEPLLSELFRSVLKETWG